MRVSKVQVFYPDQAPWDPEVLKEDIEISLEDIREWVNKFTEVKLSKHREGVIITLYKV